LNTTVSYSVNGSPAGTFAIGASGTTTFNNLAAGTYTLTSINYTNLPNSAGVGCTNPISGQTVTINVPPTVFAGNDTELCGETTSSLNLTTVGVTLGGTNASGTWTTLGSPGTIVGNIYRPNATDIFNGSVTLRYTNAPTGGIC